MPTWLHVNYNHHVVRWDRNERSRRKYYSDWAWERSKSRKLDRFLKSFTRRKERKNKQRFWLLPPSDERNHQPVPTGKLCGKRSHAITPSWRYIEVRVMSLIIQMKVGSTGHRIQRAYCCCKVTSHATVFWNLRRGLCRGISSSTVSCRITMTTMTAGWQHWKAAHADRAIPDIRWQ